MKGYMRLFHEPQAHLSSESCTFLARVKAVCIETGSEVASAGDFEKVMSSSLLSCCFGRPWNNWRNFAKTGRLTRCLKSVYLDARNRPMVKRSS